MTGGSRGIGRAVVERLTADGIRVVFTFRENGAMAQRLVDTLPGTTAIRVDGAERDAAAAMFAHVRDGLDILVNNAAINPRTPFAELTADDVDQVLAVNVRFPALAMREAATVLRDGGRIVNVSTLNTVVPAVGHALYCASKAALEQLTAVGAREFGGRGITVNTVSPGATDSDMLRAANPPAALEQAAALTALRRLGRPADIAAVVAFLVGPDAGWITGQNLRATGGYLV
ncbi:3-oxoacyl-ACP reductase [Virgisporangium aliadipatigenens]|uniref:3-oxoacyl-ACP reductase n=1 Tax=Virgisporangium aliadipatigenens TaxID=741659 RepID=A0A8J4DPN2_9ACTN|nr:3-oxoacyl-ACP reductase [Virgisporangium aliadipatigenens]